MYIQEESLALEILKIKELYDLVHALSQSEKRSFRLYCSATGAGRKSQVTRLYELLVAQEEYAEAALAQQITQQGLQRNLPTLMKRLGQQILMNQRNLRAQDTVDSRLYNSLESISFLFGKQLRTQASRILRRAQRLAARYSKIQVQLLLIGWERNILEIEQPKGKAEKKEALHREEKRLIALLTMQSELKYLANRMRAAWAKSTRAVRSEESPVYLDAAEHILIDQGMKESDFLCRALARHALGMLRMVEGQFVAASEVYLELMEQWASDKVWAVEVPDLFISCWNNFHSSVVYSESGFGKIQLFLPYIRKIPFRESQYKMKLSRISYTTELMIYLNEARFEEAGPFLEEFATWLAENADRISKSALLALHYNLCIFHFLQDDFSSANRRLQSILNLRGTEERPDIRNLARLLQIIFLCELGHIVIADNFHRSCLRHFGDAGPGSFELGILKILHPFHFDHEEGKSLDMFTQLRDFLATSKPKQQSDKPVLGMLELSLWVDSKLTGRLMQDLFREHLR